MEEILNTLIEQSQKEMEEALKKLIRIPSVIDMDSSAEGAPFGRDIRNALNGVIQLGEELGFEVKDYDGYAASIRFGNKENEKEIGILSHIDVVPPGDGWKTDPFEPVVTDGKMYGRGTIDDKGPMVAALYAMKAVKESGLLLKGHVNHIVGCDEETGHRCIKYYLTKEKGPDMGFSPDGLFSVIHAEKGILRFRIQKRFPETSRGELTIERIQAGTVVNAVPGTAKVWFRGTKDALEHVKEQFLLYNNIKRKRYEWEEELLCLIFEGVSAHAMQPWLGENPILPMLDFLKDISLADKEMHDYFTCLYEMFSDGWEGKSMGIACEDQLSGKLTMNLGIFILENRESEVKIDIRCPVHVDLNTLWKTIRLTCEKYGFKAEYWQKRPPLYIPKDAKLVRELLEVYNEMTGEESGPITIGGGTYCRDVENFVSFGPVFPGEAELAHEVNEFIDLDRFAEIAKTYAQALYRLMK